MDNSEEQKLEKSKLKMDVSKVFMYLVVIGTLLLIYDQFGEITRIWDIIRDIQFRWVALMFVIEAIYFYAAALNYHHILRIKGESVAVELLFPISIIVQFINQVLPSANISGQAFFVYQLHKRGIKLTSALGRSVLELIIVYITLGVFFILTVLLMWMQGVFALYPALYGLVAWFLIFAIPIVIIFIRAQHEHKVQRIMDWLGNITRKALLKMIEVGWLQGDTTTVAQQVKESIEDIRQTITVKTLSANKRQFITAVWWQIIEFVSHILLFYVAGQALGVHVTLLTAFVVFTTTKFISMTAYVPGAIGIFEIISTTILTAYGIDLAASITLTLLTRAFTFWLPMPIGWWMYRRYVRQT